MRRADNITTFMCRLSWNLAATTSWNPLGLSRPVMGLLDLYLYTYRKFTDRRCPVIENSFTCKWKHQLDATVLSILFHLILLLHVSGVTPTHHQELQTCTIRYGITWSRYKPVDAESSADRVLCVCSPGASVYRACRSRINRWSLLIRLLIRCVQLHLLVIS